MLGTVYPQRGIRILVLASTAILDLKYGSDVISARIKTMMENQ